MPLDNEKARAFLKELLAEKKSLTEKEVKAAVSKNFKVPVKEVGAGLIREVRKGLGIDRPAALAHAKAMLRKEPLVEAKTIVEAIADKFGIRLGPPDVSRLRPKSAKAARPRGRGARKAVAAPGAKTAPAGRKARPAVRLKAAGSKVQRNPRSGPAGAITMSFEGSGHPADLAEFFLSLGKDA